MSAFHNSAAGERFAMRAHMVWCIACLACTAQTAGGMVMLWRFCLVEGYIGSYFMGIELDLAGLMVMGIGGTVWHLWGARDHREALGRLEE